VTGVVVEKNTALDDAAELVNQAPYGDGWIALIEISDAEQLGGLLDAAAYRSFVEELSAD
jgi:glycine cleavage system H protein